MNSTMVKDFQNRIVNASKGDLLIINYEMLFVTVDEAIHAVNEDDESTFNKAMIQAHRLLRELSDNLDFRYGISKDLMSIYIYVNRQFIDASIKYDKEPLKNAKEVLSTLHKAWQQIDKANDSQPIVANGQHVYAGLTYGKGTLNETVYDNTNSRGFKA